MKRFSASFTSSETTSGYCLFVFAWLLIATPSLSYCAENSLAENESRRPNIVLVMADDMGYTDIGCYGSEIETPVLDRLAFGGLRFTQLYNTSRCCPTRAALLTGLYSHQAGIGLMTGDRGYEAYRGDLNRKCMTVAEVLGASGYRTYMSGKWHVTKHVRPDSDQSNWPLQRGFDRFYGTIIGAGSFYDPATLCRGNTFITPENDPKYQPESFYYTDAISDNAVRYIAEHQTENAETPFFLYVSYTSAHWPMHAPKSDVERYQGKYDVGYEAIREARYQRGIELGVIDSKWPLGPSARQWDRAKHKEWELRNMEVYAAMVDRMDQGIGRIVAELERHGQLEQTLFIYLQDNGGCAEGYGRSNNSEQAAKFDFQPLGRDGLQTKIWPPMQTRDGRWVRTGPETLPGEEDTFVAYGTGWANVSNTPFRGYKHDALEGGISTPLIVHWPQGIADDQRGALVKAPCHLIDFLPTFVEVAGADYPSSRDEIVLHPLEGRSFAPSFVGRELSRSVPLFFEHHGNKAARDGKWKIVSSFQQGKPNRWALYDMELDRVESKDLSEEHPEIKQRLVAEWQEWAERVGVQPWPFKNKGQ